MTSPTVPRLPGSCALDEVIEATEEAGAVIIEDWIAPSVLGAFNEQIEPWLAAHPGTDSGSAASNDFLGRNTRRLQGLLAKAPAFLDVLLDERLGGLAEHVLGPISPGLLMNNGEVIDIGPGEPAQPMHRDDDGWNFAYPGGPMIVNSILALEDITPEMGATLVVPGSHRWPAERLPTATEVVAGDLPAGAGLLFRGDVLHAGGHNRSDRRRRALSTALCCGWLRPVENSYLNLSRELVGTLPPRARALLGYELFDASEHGGGFLGYWEMGDPARILDARG